MEANLQEQLSGHLHFRKQKVGQGHVVQFGNDAIRWQISKSAIFFYIFDFAKIRPVVTKVIQRQTCTEKQTRQMAIGEIADFPKQKTNKN